MYLGFYRLAGIDPTHPFFAKGIDGSINSSDLKLIFNAIIGMHERWYFAWFSREYTCEWIMPPHFSRGQAVIVVGQAGEDCYTLTNNDSLSS